MRKVFTNNIHTWSSLSHPFASRKLTDRITAPFQSSTESEQPPGCGFVLLVGNKSISLSLTLSFIIFELSKCFYELLSCMFYTKWYVRTLKTHS